MKTVTKENIYETVINKSRFISYLAPIQSTEEAKTYLANLKALYPVAKKAETKKATTTKKKTTTKKTTRKRN
jgi:putative IMPACT (imprinted ancient) family translation regulator